jgi:hypothetical protein
MLDKARTVRVALRRRCIDLTCDYADNFDGYPAY